MKKGMRGVGMEGVGVIEVLMASLYIKIRILEIMSLTNISG